ncbi:MAG TPA: hypothetical protein VHQ90_26565 [Thermoanaerobaculia bacterium]|nr:hypothetical protein [Thermoanaerobaculia bacterium]
MSTQRRNAFPIVVLAAVLALLPVLAQAEQTRQGGPALLASGAQPWVGLAGDRDGERVGFLSALWRLLVGVWAKNGMTIDPNGGTHAIQPPRGAGVADGGTAAFSAKEGMSIDPNGSHAAPPSRGRGLFGGGAAPRWN